MYNSTNKSGSFLIRGGSYTTTELQKMLQNNNKEDEVIDLHEHVSEDDIKH